eukprot:gene18857-20757_t
MASNQAKEVALISLLGFSIGVLFAVLYGQLNGYDFGLSCNTYMHGNSQSMVKGKTNEISNKPIVFDDLEDVHHKGGDKLAKNLEKKVRVLCWVMTSPERLQTKGKAVKETWGKRCNKILFMSTANDAEFPAISLHLDRRDSWSKTRAAWQYVYENHLNEADWFMKADDETFVIVENLRLLLSKYKTSDAHYFGRWFKVEDGFNSDFAGYVFSKQTLKEFVNVMPDHQKCSDISIGEDGNVGKCLASVGIHPEDTRDDFKRETFHPFSPENHIVPGSIRSDHWLHRHNKFPVFSGADCCSDNSITFHNIRPEYMYILEYLIYHLRPYGVQNIPLIKNKPVSVKVSQKKGQDTYS